MSKVKLRELLRESSIDLSTGSTCSIAISSITKLLAGNLRGILLPSESFLKSVFSIISP